MKQKARIGSIEEPMNTIQLILIKFYYIQDVAMDSWESTKREQSIILALQET